MTNNKGLPTQHGNRQGLLAATVSALLILSVASARGQAPPPSDLVDTSTGVTTVTDSKVIPMWSGGNKVNIDLTGLGQAGVLMEVYEMTGQLILEEKIATMGIYTREIDNVNTGYVIVRILDGNAWVNRKLFLQAN